MAIVVNGERIEDSAIEAEVMRGRRGGPPPSGPPGFDTDEALRRQARENLISRTLLQQQARKSETVLSDEEIDAGFRKLMDENGGREAFFRQAGLSEIDAPKVRQHVELNLRIEKLIDSVCKDVATPTEEDAKQYYKNHTQDFLLAPEVRVSHVVKRPGGPQDDATYRRMVEVRQELLDGADFAEVANQQSDCQEEPDGDLGFFPKGKMVEAFEAIVFSMNVGEISPVFMTQFGYHIATVTEKREARQQLFEEVEERVVDQLKDERDGEAIDQYMKALRQKAAIKEVAEPAAKKPTKQKGKGKKGKGKGK